MGFPEVRLRCVGSNSRPSLVRRRADVLGEAALIWNGSTELGSDVTEELTACMIAKAQHDTPRGNLSKES